MGASPPIGFCLKLEEMKKVFDKIKSNRWLVALTVFLPFMGIIDQNLYFILLLVYLFGIGAYLWTEV